MNKKTIRILGIYALICILIAAALLVIGVGFAEYTRVSKGGMRVISAFESDNTRFSSDLLFSKTGNEINYWETRIGLTTGSNSSPAVSVFQICSYPIGNPGVELGEELTYTINLNVMKYDENGNLSVATSEDVGDEEIDVEIVGASNSVIKLSGSKLSDTITGLTLTQAVREHSVKVSMSGGLADSNIVLQFQAIPANAGITPLAGVFSSSIRGSEQSQAWYGRFHESAQDANAYDGYNYIITGSGMGTMTLSWEGSGLEPNKLSEYYDKNNDEVKIITTEEDKRFDIQFYKTGSGAVDLNKVSCTFIPG